MSISDGIIGPTPGGLGGTYSKEYVRRMGNTQKRMEDHWREVLATQVPPWALWCSRYILPKWYKVALEFMLMRCPRDLALLLHNNNWPDWVITVTHFCTSIITFPLSVLLLRPPLWLRKRFATWGCWIRIEKTSKYTMRLTVIRWWKTVDVSTWEI